MEKCDSCKKVKIKTLLWENEKCVEKLICINPKCKKYDKTKGNFYII